jgi:hypothetical protein
MVECAWSQVKRHRAMYITMTTFMVEHQSIRRISLGVDHLKPSNSPNSYIEKQWAYIQNSHPTTYSNAIEISQA